MGTLLFFTVRNIKKLSYYRFFHNYSDTKTRLEKSVLKKHNKMERNEEQ